LIALLYIHFFLLSSSLLRIPHKWLSLPHGDYWLAAERRNEMLCEIRARIAWVCAAYSLFKVAVMQLVVEANLHPEPRSSPGIA
jgi:hypothetical protein